MVEFAGPLQRTRPWASVSTVPTNDCRLLLDDDPPADPCERVVSVTSENEVEPLPRDEPDCLVFLFDALSCYNGGMATMSYLDRFLDPVTDAFTPEVAQRIVDLRADPQIEEEIESLRHKANSGTLTSQEDAAYKDFVEALDVISIFQSKARQFLLRHIA
jgi:hypothetical protein